MRDPLDPGVDGYEVLNEEAVWQGQPGRAGSTSGQREIQRLFAQLRAGSRDRGRLFAARDRLTHVDHRLEVDLFRYWCGDGEEPGAAGNPQAATLAKEPVPLPDLPFEQELLRLVIGMEQRWVEVAVVPPSSFSTIADYDQALRWELPLEQD